MCVCKTYEIKKIVNIVDIILSIIWQKLQNMNKERDQNQFFFYKKMVHCGVLEVGGVIGESIS